MAETTTYIKIDRNILKWRWFQDKNTLIVWLWLLITANVQPHDFRMETIQRGEAVATRKKIMAATGLTEREVRTALEHLKLTGEVTVRTSGKYQVISITEYDKYQTQTTEKKSGKRPASARQAPGKRPHYKNDNKVKNEKNENNRSGATTTTTFPPTREEVAAYAAEIGAQIDVDAFMRYNEGRGWKLGRSKAENWRPLVDGWAAKEPEFNPQASGSPEEETDDFGRPIRRWQ